MHQVKKANFGQNLETTVSTNLFNTIDRLESINKLCVQIVMITITNELRIK